MLSQLACSRRSTAESQIDQNQNLEGRKRKRKESLTKNQTVKKRAFYTQLPM